MFYKNDSGELLAGLVISGPDINLSPDDTTAEVAGWKWFESEEEARLAYDLVAVSTPIPEMAVEGTP